MLDPRSRSGLGGLALRRVMQREVKPVNLAGGSGRICDRPGESPGLRKPKPGSPGKLPRKDRHAILHPFAGSIQQYLEEISDPDQYRPNHCPQCEAIEPPMGHGFYHRTLV